MNNVMERAEAKANFPIRKLLGIVGGGDSDDSSEPSKTEATTDSESTQWQDSMKTTIGSGQIGRGRLLVTENTAKIDFTQYFQVSGRFRPEFESAQRDPIKKVEFSDSYTDEGPSGALLKKGGDDEDDAISGSTAKGVSSFMFKGSDIWLRIGSGEYPESELGQSSLLPSKIRRDPSFDFEHLERNNPGLSMLVEIILDDLHDYDWTSFVFEIRSDASLKPPDGIETTGSAFGYGTGVTEPQDIVLDGVTWKFSKLIQYWENRAIDFRITDLSRPYACFYPEKDYKVTQNATQRNILCLNAGEEDIMPSNYDQSISSMVFHKGVKVTLTSGNISRTFPDDFPNWSPKGDWYLVPNLGITGIQLDNSVEKITVISSGKTWGEDLALDSYFSSEQLQFGKTGTFSSVYQTNARAEAVSSPATWDMCECDSYSSRGVCADLARIPAGRHCQSSRQWRRAVREVPLSRSGAD